MRRSIVIFCVLFVLAFVLMGGPATLTSLSSSEVAPAEEPGPSTEIIRPTDGQSGFWPYLNAEPRFQKRSPINVVVVGEMDTVLEVLLEASDTNWQITTEEFQEADPGTYSLFGSGDGGDNETAANASNESIDGVDGNLTDDTLTEDNPTDDNPTDDHPTDDNPTDDNPTDHNLTANATVDNESAANASVVNEGIVIGGTRITWTRATGSTRYAYLEDTEGDGEWVTETSQVHDGTYYGHRFHIRMYASPNESEPWVAMQTHSEHFDWFTLRHRVHGSQEAQARLEADMMATPQVDVQEDVRRVFLGNSNSSDADGWATFVRLAGFLLAGAIVGSRIWAAETFERARNRIDGHLTQTDRSRIASIQTRVTIYHGLLGGVILGLILGVRRVGILLETTGTFSVYQIAAILYPFIALGLPIGTYLVARKLERRIDAAVIAGTAFAAGVWFDFAMLQVDVIPVDVLFQRMLLVIALGMIAAGATNRAIRQSWFNGLVVSGIIGWLLVIVATLFGYL